MGVVQPINGLPGDGLGIWGEMQLARNSFRRGGMVAGDHLHADARLLAFADRGKRLIAGRIDQPEQAEQRCPVLNIGEAEIALLLG